MSIVRRDVEPGGLITNSFAVIAVSISEYNLITLCNACHAHRAFSTKAMNFRISSLDGLENCRKSEVAVGPSFNLDHNMTLTVVIQ